MELRNAFTLIEKDLSTHKKCFQYADAGLTHDIGNPGIWC